MTWVRHGVDGELSCNREALLGVVDISSREQPTPDSHFTLKTLFFGVFSLSQHLVPNGKSFA
jgi:hypothetical protein